MEGEGERKIEMTDAEPKEPCCPKCGGTVGFRYFVRSIDHRMSCWTGEFDETAECYPIQSDPKTVVCQECGKRVPNPFYKEPSHD